MADAPLLESYLAGAWHRPEDDGEPVRDAVTGQPVARVSRAGVDVTAAARYARETGGPALRALTFAERVPLVKAVAGVLTEARDELYALSARSGATRRDSAVDIDGAIGTLAVFASLGRRGLPDSHVLPDGEAEPLGKGGTFAGQHILTPRRGAAVQINAYNFPV